MPKDRIQIELAHLGDLKSDGPSDNSLKELRKALGNKSNVIVAKAAGIAGEWQSRALIPSLVEAFARLLEKPDMDTQCTGKIAISQTLKDFGFAESVIFVRGIRHFQWESTWGSKIDTAPVLRAICALALVQCTDLPRHETLLLLTEALTEPDATVRADAARALEQMGGREVSLLLRLKARCGDKEPRVSGQVLECILGLEGSSGVPFVAEFLKCQKQEVAEECALALGASRLPEAIRALQDAWLNLRGRIDGAVLLRAISSSRQDSALEFLLQQVRTGERYKAEDALFALALHKGSEPIAQRVKSAVEGRPELLQLFEEKFS